MNPEQSELGFKLDQTSETAWDDLIVLQKNWSAKGIFRVVRASVGPAGGTEYPTKATFRLVFLPLPWAIVCFVFCLSTLAGLIVLGRRSSILKDSAGGPFSLARTQMAVWTWLTVSSYFFLFVMWWDSQVPIPTSILGLLGISASTYMAAALVDRTGSNTPPAVSRGFLKDICGGDQGVQLHRIQIIAWTVVLAFAYVMNILTKLSIPDFNPTLLGLLGLSAGTYVGFKFPENQSPVSTQTQPAAPVSCCSGGRRWKSESGKPSRAEKITKQVTYFFGLGHLASTVVPMPPRGRNTPFTIAHCGLQARTVSSNT